MAAAAAVQLQSHRTVAGAEVLAAPFHATAQRRRQASRARARRMQGMRPSAAALLIALRSLVPVSERRYGTAMKLSTEEERVPAAQACPSVSRGTIDGFSSCVRSTRANQPAVSFSNSPIASPPLGVW
jgi:hypothetical protein